jgi:hypothetical protein
MSLCRHLLTSLPPFAALLCCTAITRAGVTLEPGNWQSASNGTIIPADRRVVLPGQVGIEAPGSSAAPPQYWKVVESAPRRPSHFPRLRRTQAHRVGSDSPCRVRSCLPPHFSSQTLRWNHWRTDATPRRCSSCQHRANRGRSPPCGTGLGDGYPRHNRRASSRTYFPLARILARREPQGKTRIIISPRKRLDATRTHPASGT